MNRRTNYTLDGVGNRTSQTVGSNTIYYNYSADDELTSTTNWWTNTYTYNANGEHTVRQETGYDHWLSYDYDGQLTQILQSTCTTSYAYDALGRRVSRTAGGVTTSFQYAGNSVLLEKQGGTTTRTYTYGSALIRMNGEFPLFDGLGSERTVTDSSQTVTGTIAYNAFGQTVASSGSSSSPYLFGATSGYRTEGDAGLMLVGARYYDPQVGRFTSRDTVLSEHPYVYCDADPVNRVDPTGHYSWRDFVNTVGIIGGTGSVIGLLPSAPAWLNPVGSIIAIPALVIGAHDLIGVPLAHLIVEPIDAPVYTENGWSDSPIKYIGGKPYAPYWNRIGKPMPSTWHDERGWHSSEFE